MKMYRQAIGQKTVPRLDAEIGLNGGYPGIACFRFGSNAEVAEGSVLTYVALTAALRPYSSAVRRASRSQMRWMKTWRQNLSADFRSLPKAAGCHQGKRTITLQQESLQLKVMLLTVHLGQEW